MGKRVDHEGPIHKACLQYLRLTLPGAVIHHSPGEVDVRGNRGRNISAASRNKAKGMMVGFPDLIVLWRGRLMGIEVKAPKGRPTDAQKAVGELIEANGGFWCVVRSVDDLRAALSEWREDEGETWQSAGGIAARMASQIKVKETTE